MPKNIYEIIPGTRNVIRCLSIALVIVAMFFLLGNILILKNVSKGWMLYLTYFSFIINIIYIYVLHKCIKIDLHGKNMSHHYRITAFVLLLVACIPCLTLLLCGGDYILYEILGWYIFLDTDKIIFPIATILFVTITYWLPIMSLERIHKQVNNIITIKNNYVK